jgi:hypothetical protein
MESRVGEMRWSPPATACAAACRVASSAEPSDPRSTCGQRAAPTATRTDRRGSTLAA